MKGSKIFAVSPAPLRVGRTGASGRQESPHKVLEAKDLLPPGLLEDRLAAAAPRFGVLLHDSEINLLFENVDPGNNHFQDIPHR